MRLLIICIISFFLSIYLSTHTFVKYIYSISTLCSFWFAKAQSHQQPEKYYETEKQENLYIWEDRIRKYVAFDWFVNQLNLQSVIKVLIKYLIYQCQISALIMSKHISIFTLNLPQLTNMKIIKIVKTNMYLQTKTHFRECDFFLILSNGHLFHFKKKKIEIYFLTQTDDAVILFPSRPSNSQSEKAYQHQCFNAQL